MLGALASLSDCSINHDLIIKDALIIPHHVVLEASTIENIKNNADHVQLLIADNYKGIEIDSLIPSKNKTKTCPEN